MSIPKYNPVERITKPEPESDNNPQAYSTIVKAGIWLIATVLLLGF